MFGDLLAVAEKGVLGAGTVNGGVHRPVCNGAPPGVVRCHCHVFPKAGVFGVELRGSPPWAPPPYV